MPGKLITFEGIEGSGKTTQIGLLAEHLRGRGLEPLETREPGGTAFGDRIRRQLLDADAPVRIDPGAELLLFLAARTQHLAEVVLPALGGGRIVLCDRYRDATIVYQGDGRGLPVERIEALERAAGIERVPDLTILLDLDVDAALERMRNRHGGEAASRFDRETVEFHRRVQRGYLRIAAAEPGRLFRVDSSRPKPEVHDEIRSLVDRFLDREGSA